MSSTLRDYLDEIKFLVDANLLKTDRNPNSIQTNGRVYNINGSLFWENVSKDQSDYVDFDVDSLLKFCTDVDPGNHLPIKLRRLSTGVIVNSRVFLTYEQWNTIKIVSEEKSHCAVCDCDVSLPLVHIYLSKHKENLATYRPLKEYNSSIIRKIGKKFYCSICNCLFKKKKHFEIKQHIDKLTFAVKCAINILAEGNLSHNINDHSNRQNIREQQDATFYPYNDMTTKIKDCQTNNTLDSGFHQPNSSSSECTETEKSFFNDCDCNGDDYKLDNDCYRLHNPTVEEVIKVANSDETVENLPSYASVLKKDLKTTELENFHSWHMIIDTKSTEFYCMACKQNYNMDEKKRHCADQSHLSIINGCKIIEKYRTYFIREVDNKFYHCGLCNNLQLIFSIEKHINEFHSTKSINSNLNPSEVTENNNIPKTMPNQMKFNSHPQNTNQIIQDTHLNHNRYNSYLQIPKVYPAYHLPTIQKMLFLSMIPAINARNMVPVKPLVTLPVVHSMIPANVPILNTQLYRNLSNSNVTKNTVNMDITNVEKKPNDRKFDKLNETEYRAVLETDVNATNESVSSSLNRMMSFAPNKQEINENTSKFDTRNEITENALKRSSPKDNEALIETQSTDNKLAIDAVNKSDCNELNYDDTDLRSETEFSAEDQKVSDTQKESSNEANEKQNSAPNDYTLSVNNDEASCPRTHEIKENNGGLTEKPVSSSYNTIQMMLLEKQTLSLCGLNLKITNMAYHMIWKHQTSYNCGLCNFSSDLGRIIMHVFDSFHVWKLNNIRFEPTLGYINMIRCLGRIFHCAICNVFVQVPSIHLHINNHGHVLLLRSVLANSTLLT